MKKLRFGFLSTAGIGRKNWKAILHSGNCVISAVASRDAKKSRAFIRDCQRESPFAAEPAAFGSYEELLASPDVDAVYIPLPTGLRKEWVLRAAAAGKHVVCEKPCAVNAADLEEMISACRQNRVQFMDGVMFMHNPRLARVRKFLDDGKSVGEVRRISSAFSFYNGREFFRDNIRVNAALEPAGCLGDLGWYCIRFALWAMNWQLPREVTGTDAFAARREVADGIFRRTDFCRRRFRRILLFISRRLPAMGFGQRPERLAAAAGFCASVRQLSTRVRGEPSRSPGHFRRRNARRKRIRWSRGTRPRRTRGCSATLRTRFFPAS